MNTFLFFLVFLFGVLQLTFITSYFLKRKSDLPEYLIFFTLSLFFFYPFLLFIICQIIRLPVVSIVIYTSFVLLLINFFCKKIKLKTFSTQIFSEFSWSIKDISIIICYILVLSWFITILPGLPDSDPYYWTKQASLIDLSNPLSLKLTDYRPLFLFFTALISYRDTASGAYVSFKYLLPLIWTSWIFFAFLLKKYLQPTWKKWLFIFLPLCSPAFFLTSIGSLPQSIFHFTLLISLSLIWYGSRKKEAFWSYLNLLIIFISAFFFEFSFILFAVLVVALLINSREKILYSLQYSPKKIYLFLTILILSLWVIKDTFIFRFIIFWANKLSPLFFHSSINLIFPYSYTNIDGNNVGWGNFQGVLQYYAFYGGLFAFILPIFFFRNIFPLKKISRDTASLYIFGLIFCFLFLSEILPRFFNIALLPERLLPLVSAIVVFWFLVDTKKEVSLKIQYFLVSLTIIHAMAAGYIHFQKSYAFNKVEFTALEYMQNNLPENAILYTPNDKYFIASFLNLSICPLVGESLYNYFYFQKYFDDAKKYAEKVGYSDPCLLDNSRPMYIYYSEPRSENPYRNRPYMKERYNNYPDELFFNSMDSHFEKIFNNDENNIFIWKYTP